MRAALLAMAAAGLLACAPQDQAVGDPAPETAEEATRQDICGASAFDYLLGTPASEIDQTTLPEGARIITPDMMVTQDFRADRLNIITDTDGRVSSLSCF
ncbi:MAG: hypothetical protein K2P58_03640 [Hyphomonadaceae bacterium]|nr:hypothetical protein [Hyphomonadaceae bacterium]